MVYSDPHWDVVVAERDMYRKALEAASGYLLNALIDLDTNTPKGTHRATIEGGLRMVRAALASKPDTGKDAA